jgi:Tfp pilus assembly protein PilF
MGGSVDEAKKLAAQIEKLDAGKGYSVWADIYKKEGNDSKYEEYLKKSFEVSPPTAEQINSYGYWLLGKKRADEAIVWFKKNTENAPTDANSFDSLGDGFMAKNQTDEALRSYLKAVSINPKFSSSVINAAKIYSKKNQKQEAVTLLKNYIKIATNEDEKEKAEDLLDDIE